MIICCNVFFFFSDVFVELDLVCLFFFDSYWIVFWVKVMVVVLLLMFGFVFMVSGVIDDFVVVGRGFRVKNCVLFLEVDWCNVDNEFWRFWKFFFLIFVCCFYVVFFDLWCVVLFICFLISGFEWGFFNIGWVFGVVEIIFGLLFCWVDFGVEVVVVVFNFRVI